MELGRKTDWNGIPLERQPEEKFNEWANRIYETHFGIPSQTISIQDQYLK
jgi:hypothetical protein